MIHRIDPRWDMDWLTEELETATGVVRMYESYPELSTTQAERLALWRDFEHQLRDRMTVVGLTAELDALEGK